VNFKGVRRSAVATVTSEDEAAAALRRYAVAHAKSARTLGKLMGVPMEGDMTEAAATIPIVKISASL